MAAVEVFIASLIVLVTRARRVPVRPGWRPGAVEIPVSFVPKSKRRALELANGKQQPRLFRPVMLVGLLVAFAGLGAGFGDFKVDPTSVYAPGTPVASVVVVQLDPTVVDTPTGDTASSDVQSFAAAPATDTETQEPPTPTPTDEPTATPEPTEEPSPEPTVAAAATEPPPPPEPTSDPVDLYPVSQLSVEEVHAAALAAGWPAELLDEVTAVAWCESRYRPNAQSSVAYGIMQLVPTWFRFAGVDFASWTDPVVNLRVAYTAYRYDIDNGNAPWSQWLCKPSVSSPPAAEPTATNTPPATATASATSAPWPESSVSPVATDTIAAAEDVGAEATPEEPAESTDR